jgi:hypothetical protein
MATADSARSDVEAVLGPPPRAPNDPGLVFLRVIDGWMVGPWCSDDQDRARRALQHIQAAMFSGGTAFVADVYRVAGGVDMARSYALRPGLDESGDARRARGRNIVALGDLAHRGVLPIARAIARYRHFVLRKPLPLQRSRLGITAEIAFFEEVLGNVCTLKPFQPVPEEDHWTVPEGQVWWALWCATVPVETMRESLERLVVRGGERHRAAHAEAYCDRVVWEEKYAPPKRRADMAFEEGGPRSPGKKPRWLRSMSSAAPKLEPASATTTAEARPSGAPFSCGRGRGGSGSGRGAGRGRGPHHFTWRAGPLNS